MDGFEDAMVTVNLSSAEVFNIAFQPLEITMAEVQKPTITVSEDMIAAGVRELKDWGGIEHPNLVSADLIEGLIRSVLAGRYEVSVDSDGKRFQSPGKIEK